MWKYIDKTEYLYTPIHFFKSWDVFLAEWKYIKTEMKRQDKKMTMWKHLLARKSATNMKELIKNFF